MAIPNEEQQDKIFNNSMKKLSKRFNDIKSSFISNSISSRSLSLDAKIEDSLKRLSNTSIDRNALNYADNIKHILTKNIDSNSFASHLTSTVLASADNAQRMSRYANSEEIINNISYCGRAIKVLADGIVSPDNITKEVIQIMSESDDENTKDAITKVKAINSELNLDKSLFRIAYDTLKYGDVFVEICDYKSDEIPITQSLYLTEKSNYLNESANGRKSKKPKKISNVYNVPFTKKVADIIINENGQQQEIFRNEVGTEKIIITIVEDISPNGSDRGTFLQEQNKSIIEQVENQINEDFEQLTKKKKKKKDDDDKELNLQDLRVLFHDPTKVIKLQSEKYKMNLGFLILPVLRDGGGAPYTSPGAGTPTGGSKFFGYSSVSTMDYGTDYGIDDAYKNILKLIKKYVKNEDLNVNKGEFKELLNKAVRDVEEEGEGRVVKIRYVPPERMEHFTINNQTHFPYGEGIFEKSMFDAKMLIALKSAVTMRRINDSSDKRVIYVDIGTPRNYRNAIESLKEALQKRKHSVGSWNNISSIPTSIISYEDFIIPQKNGKKFVEFDTLNPQVNISDATEQLKFYRDEVVSSLEVPPAFLNLEENLSNKSVLAHESSLFAETILSYQKIFSDHLFGLYSKIYKYAYKKALSRDINITLPPPKMLYIEKEAENLEVVARIVETGKQLGASKDYLIKKYWDEDWDKMAESEINEILDKRGKPSNPEEMGGAMGGMGMGGAAPPPGGGMDMGSEFDGFA